MKTRSVLAALFILVSGCGGPGPAMEAGRPVAPGGLDDASVLVPPGYGTLTQAQFTLRLQSGDLQIQVTPLAESVIRLAAPDTYERLAGMAASAGAALQSWARDGSPLFLVSMFSRAPTTVYEPENLHVVSGGLRYRPTAIDGVTPGWGGQRLRQQETQMAIYAFQPGIELGIALTVEYEGVTNSGWERIVIQLERERARVRARAGF